MKALLSLFLLVSAAGYAAEQTFTNEKGEHAPAAVPTQEQMEEATSGIENAIDAAHPGYWHCTAYADGHNIGYSFQDEHYSHAYYGAIDRCEAATHHHCHDVHCHFDN